MKISNDKFQTNSKFQKSKSVSISILLTFEILVIVIWVIFVILGFHGRSL